MIDYAELIKNPGVFYAALVAFVIAVSVDLYMRVRKAKHEDNSPMSHRMEKALAYFKEKRVRKRITNDTYQELTGISHSTASRDLDKFVELGYLEKQGKTSSTTYNLVASKKK